MTIRAQPLNEKLICFVSFAPTVTCCSCWPYFSCHATMVYVPGGRFPMENWPSILETEKYGCGMTAMYDFIQPWTSHLMRNGVISGLSNFLFATIPCTGWPSLNWELTAGMAWML